MTERRSWTRLGLDAAVVVLLSAIVSHAVARGLGIRAAPVNRLVVGPELGGPPVLVLGSSVTLYGLAPEILAARLARPVAMRFVPSGSPSELETEHAEASPAATAVVGVCSYDLNELVLADRRPELVPLGRSVADLRDSDADWPLAKRVLGQYLLHGLRRLYPTAGRSEMVMTGLRRAALDLAAGRRPSREPGPPAGPAAGEAVVFDPRMVPDTEDRLDEWTPERRLRSLAGFRATGRDRHGFFGVKWRALRRLAAAAPAEGATVLVVFPVSPLYEREFLGTSGREQFEAVLQDVARAAPRATILRLDADPALRQDRVFRDLVHLGPEGRRRATEAVVAALGAR